MSIEGFTPDPACPMCVRTARDSRAHECQYIKEVRSDNSIQPLLRWTCWHCGYIWHSLTAWEQKHGLR